MKHLYECMHCHFDNVAPMRDPEEMLVVTCSTCGGLHHLRQGILTKAFAAPAKFDVRADQPGASIERGRRSDAGHGKHRHWQRV
jgi:hypothetical protein